MVFLLGGIYLFFNLQGVIGNRYVKQVVHEIRIEDDDELLHRVSGCNGESWACLFLFGGLKVWFAFKVYSGDSISLLSIFAVFLIAAYAYLVEVVNIKYLLLDDDYPSTFSRTLPWLNRPILISPKK